MYVLEIESYRLRGGFTGEYRTSSVTAVCVIAIDLFYHHSSMCTLEIDNYMFRDKRNRREIFLGGTELLRKQEALTKPINPFTWQEEKEEGVRE
ncbi:hypothetical protein CEXT_184331 [Caerostris extrusa]|uniref:Uncharacterized protein n=1 Tax=Caerostris extrusa TaxID=172846 RepID=A0AAV4N400_CAEEX|nr:hypothetical protein CEXT_184331 [Caerostris extrusa]